MRIVVIGGSGLIGTKLVRALREMGHEALAASRSSGVNAVTSEGLTEALAGAQVVVDVANSPSLEEKATLEFFKTSTRNLIAAETTIGVRHHVVLSIVGAERIPESGYFRAKMAQEKLIKASGIPYTILYSTQFFEFISRIVQSSSKHDVIRLSPALVQPIASDDVVVTLAGLAVGPPLNAAVETAGPEAWPLDKLAQRFVAATNDQRQVMADIHARYFGARLNDRSLTPRDRPLFGSTRFEDWLSRTFPQ